MTDLLSPDAVEEKLGAITFVKLADDTVENEDAHKYLRKLCREENTSCDKDLLSLCAKGYPHIEQASLWVCTILGIQMS